MDEQNIISKLNEYLHEATKELCNWLEKMLPRVTENWWIECVLNNLSQSQRKFAEENGQTNLNQLDLAALLRIADKSWYDMRSFAYLPYAERQIIRDMSKVRNTWAHCAGELPEKGIIIDNLNTILSFFESVIITNKYTDKINEFISEVQEAALSISGENSDVLDLSQESESYENDVVIRPKDVVYLTGDPNSRGMVFSVSDVDGEKKYDVFVDGALKTFYQGQIKLVDAGPKYKWIDVETLQSNLTAYEINNPSAGNLYSLNAARIDFVPYQFRPALKMIKSDEPKILIADSVGVGKTIEAGLIVKEMEARKELDNILIICPKPLVAERKWEMEMKRFDEEFVQLDGPELRQIISDVHRDEEWPVRYNKAIIPYSILDGRAYEGEDGKHGRKYGLLDLDPPPHFDLVIIDEAHHIRNGSLEKDKAFAYKCVRYFCEHADAVVMLTATPLQTSDNDLFTLLNLLRPDVVMDRDVFKMMSRPNEYIYRASHAIRSAEDGWAEIATDELDGLLSTQWGNNVIARNPVYRSVLTRLQADKISREERVKLISDIESLHSFNTMLNRTRRKDIQDFCIRRPFTVEVEFTDYQKQLHDELLKFEHDALSMLHNEWSIPFMMSTIKRQAASCIFGLAPQIRAMISRRFTQIAEDPDVDTEGYSLSLEESAVLTRLAKHTLEMADNLPEDDPKLDAVLKIINEKQKQDNNKIILFSSFRHTLSYLSNKFNNCDFRFAEINGSTKDDDRLEYRRRFELDKSDPDALDLLMFTEVGSEGLDYQFCDTMVNYDLPWNPMRIEQRIGRIDRRGQKSEAVNIYNVITAETVDAEIYNRCLVRVGIFERSVGECEEVLGSIASKIEQIAMDTKLTDIERRKKLEQMTDNEIRRMQELTKLEDEERALFGFDLSNYTASSEIKDAESPWISPANIQRLVERYLNDRLGNGQYILGRGDLKHIRLNKEARLTLLNDFRRLPNVRSALKRRWENYLKSTEPLHLLTFLPEAATKERKAFFITPMHPLVKQAAKYYATNVVSNIHIEAYSEELPEGSFPFSVYSWSYTGIHPMFKAVFVCSNDMIGSELSDIIQNSNTSRTRLKVNSNTWSELESKHISLWREAKEKYLVDVNNTANYRKESISSNYRNQKRNLEKKINEIFDERIVRMYQSELNNATERYQAKMIEIEESVTKADIHTSLITNGIIDIKRGK